MDIVDTSNGPAIRDADGYIILPNDVQGLLHVSTLDSAILNTFLDTIAQYVEDGLNEFRDKIVVNDSGQIDTVSYEDIQDTVHLISKGSSSAGLMAQIANGLLNGLVNRPVQDDDGDFEPNTYISFPPGYHYAVVKVEPGVVAQPVSYYPEMELIPEDVRRATLDGSYEVYTKTGPVEHRFLTPDEVLATLPE